MIEAALQEGGLQGTPDHKLQEACSLAVIAKNSIPLSCGYSPNQAVFGYPAKLPMALDGDDPAMGHDLGIGESGLETHIANHRRNLSLIKEKFYQWALRERMMGHSECR